MKKRYLVISLTVIIVFALCIVPALVERISNEQNHRGYVVALEAAGTMQDSFIDIYKEAGVNTIIFDEENNEFDNELISFYKDKGFDIAIRLYVGEKKKDDYAQKLDKLVKENNIRYMVVRLNKEQQNCSAPLDNVIIDNDMVLVVSENMSQLSNEMPKGYTGYMKAADGRILRAYETLKNPTGTLGKNSEIKDFGDLIFHHMINSVRDRNTEFMYVNQLDVASLSEEEAVRQTARAIESYYGWVEDIGYIEHKTPDLKDYETNKQLTSAAAALIGCLMAMAVVEIILKKQIPVFENIMYVLSFISFALTFVMPEMLINLYPSVFVLISACFSFSAVIYVSDLVCKKKGFTLSLVYVFLISLLVLFFGAAVMSALLSGTDYYLNNLIFRGVKLSLVFPLAFAFVGAWLYINDGRLAIKPGSLKTGFQKIKIWHIVPVVIAIAAAGIYVIRSGNTQISMFENHIRNFISEVSKARPRTKEFLIGYPLLALMVYYTKNPCNKLIRWITTVGSSILFASVTNTFCHVFTDFSISALRTVNGLVFSIPFVLIVLGINYLFARFVLNK